MTSHRDRIGLLAAGVEPAELRAAATAVEQLGFAELWVPEDYFESGGLTAAAIALTATEHIPVGIGVLSVLTRHPALTAMELGTLAAAFPGRLRAGLGLGLAQSVEQLGLLPPSPLRAVREGVDGVRELLAGRPAAGHFAGAPFAAVALAEAPATPPPLLVGALGPRMLQLAGEVGDAVIVSSLSSPAYVTWARRQLEIGAERGGRDRVPDIVDFAWWSYDDDRAAARAAIRPAVARALGFVGAGPLTDADGFSDDLADMLARGGPEGVMAEMPDHWLDELVVAGDGADCRRAVEARLAAGADRVILAPTPAGRFLDLVQAGADVFAVAAP